MIDKTKLLKDIENTIKEKNKCKKTAIKKIGQIVLYADELVYGFYYGEAKALEELKSKIEHGDFDNNNHNDSGDE